MDFTHKQPFGSKKQWWSESVAILNPVVRYSGVFDAQKGFYAATQQSQHCLLLYFWISVLSPCSQMSNQNWFLIFPSVKKLVIKLEGGVLFVSWIRLQGCS